MDCRKLILICLLLSGCDSPPLSGSSPSSSSSIMEHMASSAVGGLAAGAGAAIGHHAINHGIRKWRERRSFRRR